MNVYYQTVVGDNPERLRRAVDIAKGRADIIITTGGLGPTCDDLTKQVLARAFGLELVFHPECAQAIRDYIDLIRREQLLREGDGQGDSLLLAMQQRHRQKKAYMEEKK